MPVVETQGMQEKQASKSNARVYWSKAEKHQIKNWQREIKEAGSIKQPEQPLRFSGHTKVTDDKKMQKFIETSREFIAGAVRLVGSIDEANRLTEQQGQMKQVTTLMSTDISRDGQQVI